MQLTFKNSQSLFVKGDLDGFFGLAIDNLIQYLLIISLGTAVLGFPVSLIIGKILPGAALSLLIGNAFYSWQAQKLSDKTGRTDVTALPYGINTVSMFAYVFLVMLPAKSVALKNGMTPDNAAVFSWQIGLAACFVSGIIEFAGSFIAKYIRRATPRAALLSTLAGIAISFIAIDFALKTFESPVLAMLPLAIIITTYFSGIRLPFRIPGGALAIVAGSVTAWILFYIYGSGVVSPCAVCTAKQHIGLHIPVPVISDLISGLTHPLSVQFFVPVMLPMGIFNVLGSLQNIESAEAAGDSYDEKSSLSVNGLGSIVGSIFGSCYPTTIYIGHPGWKGLGARSGYSIMNGVFYTIVAFTGLSSLVASVVPIESGMAIVLWIGIIITAQAFQANKKSHASAVAIGLFPAIAAWGFLIVTQTLGAVANAKGDFSIPSYVLGNPGAFNMAGLHLQGLLALSQGFMFTSLIWASISVYLIEREFLKASYWALGGAILSFFGLIHAGKASPSGGLYTIYPNAGGKWALAYGMVFVFFLLMFFWYKFSKQDLEEPSGPIH
ncbi:MAG: NCS2 family permease [Deltaproteobacteria bacterium]|nr:NCS2 family permease [Deltaproteobacteria bacterium]